MLVHVDGTTNGEVAATYTVPFFWHVREHCQDQILLNPEEPKGLGFCSTQTGESMHKAFETFFATFHPCWNSVETLCDQLFKAVTKWALLAL